MSTRCRFLLPAVLCAFVVALLQAGCSDDRDPLRAPAETCVVEGRVTRFQAGEWGTRVRFTRVGAIQGAIEVPIDATGHYRLELPAGRYGAAASDGNSWYWLRRSGALVSDFADADTMIVAASATPIRFDFLFGAVRLTGEQPAGLAAPFLTVEFSQPSEWGSGGSTVRYVETDGLAGALTIDSGPLPPGDYRVRLVWRSDWSHNGERFWLPGVSTWDAAAWYHVGVDSLCEIPLPFSATPGRLEGHVTGAWQVFDTERPRVVAYALDGNPVTGAWDLEPDGGFAIDLRRPAPVKLAVEGNGSRYWLGGPREADATVFEPAPGVTISGIDAVVSGAAVRVTQLAPWIEDRNPLIEFRDAADRSLVVSTWGSYWNATTLGCLPPGQYLVRMGSNGVGADPVRAQWYDRARTPEEATVVTVPENGGIVQISFTLERGGTISGVIVPLSVDQRWGNIIVTAVGDNAVVGQRWTSGTVPDFVVKGLDDGDYKIGFLPRSYDWLTAGEAAPAGVVWYPSTTDWNAASTVRIVDAGDVTDVVITVP